MTIEVLLISLALLAVVSLLIYASANLVIPRYLNAIGQSVDGDRDFDFPPHLGGGEEDKPPEAIDEEIKAQYLVSFPKRIYVNRLFRLLVKIGAKELTLPEDTKRQVADRGPLKFMHTYFPESSVADNPRPKIRVELKFDEEEFRVANSVQVKRLPAKEEITYEFPVKSLKSEDSALGVELAYVAAKWRPKKEVMIEVTEADRGDAKTWQLTPSGFEESVTILLREDLTIETKSFLNMNQSSLNILSKATAVVLTVIYIGLVIALGLTDDVLSTVIVGISSVASAVGIPLAGDAWKNARVNKEENAAA